MPDEQDTHLCFKCGRVMSYLQAGCGCERQCGCIHWQDGAKQTCGDCADGVVIVGERGPELFMTGGQVLVNAPDGSGDA